MELEHFVLIAGAPVGPTIGNHTHLGLLSDKRSKPVPLINTSTLVHVGGFKVQRLSSRRVFQVAS